MHESYSLFALQASDADKKSHRQLLQITHDTLADIFKKIGSKDNTREVCILYILCLDYLIEPLIRRVVKRAGVRACVRACVCV